MILQMVHSAKTYLLKCKNHQAIIRLTHKYIYMKFFIPTIDSDKAENFLENSIIRL